MFFLREYCSISLRLDSSMSTFRANSFIFSSFCFSGCRSSAIFRSFSLLAFCTSSIVLHNKQWHFHVSDILFHLVIKLVGSHLLLSLNENFTKFLTWLTPNRPKFVESPFHKNICKLNIFVWRYRSFLEFADGEGGVDLSPGGATSGSARSSTAVWVSSVLCCLTPLLRHSGLSVTAWHIVMCIASKQNPEWHEMAQTLQFYRPLANADMRWATLSQRSAKLT